MIEHKILRGAGAEVYLPFARSKLQALERQDPEGFFSQWFLIGGWRIHVKQEPPFQYLTIEFIGGLAYEFFASEHVNDSTLGSPGHGSGIVDTFVCGSALRASFPGRHTAAQTHALYSTTIVPAKGDAWKLRDCEAPQGSDTGLFTWSAWQNQKFFEHCWHPHNDGKSLVTSTQAQAPGLGNQCGWMSPYAFTRLASAGSKVSDFGLDVLPTLYTSGGTTRGAPQLDNEWVYWRRAAVQTVGGRSFFISTDNYGRFQVYPVKDYRATNGIVPPAGYKQVTPPYPAWVTVPDPADFRFQVNDWLWRFNRDATKCVSIPFSSDFSNGFYKTLAGEQFFATIFPDEVPFVTPANALVPAHEDTPGLVEFGITISVTGPNDMDFDVAFTVLRSSYFADSPAIGGGRFFFDAAYFMKDTEHAKTDPAFVAEDTLITAEIECSYPSGHYAANSGETPDPFYLDLVKNVQGDIVINANDAVLTRSEQLRFTIFGPQSIKFPTLASYLSIPQTPFHDTLSGGIGGTITVNGVTTVQASAGPVAFEPETDGGGQPIAFIFGSIWALELSTLSILYETDNEVTGAVLLRGLAYGSEFYNRPTTIAIKTPTALPPADTRVPSARVHQYVLDFVINTEWGMGFNAHPLGHWAFGVDAQLGTNTEIANDLDWISVKGTDATGAPVRTRFRHKDLFNRAFKQLRDYDFYTQAFPGKGIWDQGSFRTQGVFVTFR